MGGRLHCTALQDILIVLVPTSLLHKQPYDGQQSQKVRACRLLQTCVFNLILSHLHADAMLCAVEHMGV